ncbi:TfuA domain protein, core [Pseudovibrio sp. FO-BEG1]|uniref:TfuA-like protein n=1 Tax=Pseudovibrio sp. (strain FO-BEG1) TaxID=911045 RepID=UPI000238C6AD|nr:TfuA-like protein [Pseudovibrio sp. FO-BEG1]AEV35478.1 TfuA domain protein, core [Pseudovibrio sp. FO-BEG1]
MKPVVFLGPTLPLSEAKKMLDADYRAPASQGDVYKAVKDGARLIGIIDGYFERIPAVWHKEILYALDQGVRVFGASSMGALRAAELHQFGMVGVGSVFEAYRDRQVEDDDEVAIVHGPPELGYPSLSNAMVDIRATLSKAKNERVIKDDFTHTFLKVAKSLHFSQRSYDRVFQDAKLPAEECVSFRRWLETGRVEAKRTDALQMLRDIAKYTEQDLFEYQAQFAFAHTDTWERMIRQIEPAVDGLAYEELLEELRLDPGTYKTAIEIALAQVLAEREASRACIIAKPDEFERKFAEYLVSRNIVLPQDIKSWMSEQALNEDTFQTFIEKHQRIDVVKGLLHADIVRALPDTLRDLGIFGKLKKRAEDKREYLARKGLSGVEAATSELSSDDLLEWYFTKHLGASVPLHLDAYIRSLGIDYKQAFIEAIFREFQYHQKEESKIIEKGFVFDDYDQDMLIALDGEYYHISEEDWKSLPSSPIAENENIANLVTNGATIAKIDHPTKANEQAILLNIDLVKGIE